MAGTLTIVGYETECRCDHCNRKLKHGIKIDDGRTVGATCFEMILTKPKVYNGRKCYVGAPNIVLYAKRVERCGFNGLSRFGMSVERTLTYEKADDPK